MRYLGAGWDNETFEVGGTWIFRFPKRAEIVTAQERELVALNLLRRTLPLAIPDFEYWGRASEDFPYDFVGYQKLPGQPLMAACQRPLSRMGERRIARQLGEFLSALHATEIRALTVRLPRISPPWARFSRRTQFRELSCWTSDLWGDRRLLDVLQGAHVEPESVAAGVLVHGDLGLEHLLFDPAREQITGVIDWGNLGVASALVDFVELYCFLGRSFLERVIWHYEGPVTRSDLASLARRHLAVALRNLHYGRSTGQRVFTAMGRRGLRYVLESL